MSYQNKIKYLQAMHRLVIGIFIASFIGSSAFAQVRAITIPDDAERNHLRTIYNYDDSQRKSQVVEQRWVETGAWANHRRNIYSYENDGRIISIVTQYWGAGRWNYATRETETFDGNDNLTSRTRDTWDNNAEWLPVQRDIYTYNDSNQKTEWRSQVRDNDGSWYYDWRFTYAYDENDNMVEETRQRWNRNRWELIHSTTHSYSVDGERLETIIHEVRRGSRVQKKAYIYRYHEDHGVLERLSTQRWTGSSWEDIAAEHYEYDIDGRLLRIEYYDSESLIARDIYNYNDEGNPVQRIREQRQTDGNFREEWQYNYTYDYRGYKNSKSYLDRRAGAWVEQYRINYSYDIYGNPTSSITQR